MHSGERWRLGHRPGLDGLRGVAIGLVLINHIDMPGGHYAGQAGVGAFFVLSGFLITSVLLEQRHKTGRPDLRRFYARRALRLGPALLVCVAVTWSFAAFAGIPVGPSPVVALLYLMDFLQAGGFQPGLFAHTWSLAVEEQFYLIWPLVLFGLLRLRRVNITVALAAVAVLLGAWTAWLAMTGATASRIVYAPDTRANGLIAGCALAVAFTQYQMPKVPRWAFWAALVGLPALGFLPDVGLNGTAMLLLVVPVSVVLVWACADGSSGRPALEMGWLRALGERSYGLYLWHLPLIGITLFAMPTAEWWVRAPIALAVTAVAVELSWRFVEQPLLRRRQPTVLSQRAAMSDALSTAS